MSGSYTEADIKVLEGIEHVRQRPAMYIGDVGEPGLHHLVQEVVDNAVDEALAGFCTEITVTIHDDGSCSVEDNGRGIPVGLHEKENRPAVEVVLTKLNAGGKFDKGVYKVSGGLHGVGVSCVNALSQWLEVEVYRDGKVHKQRYERARTCYDLKVTGKTEKRGTRVHFSPDPQIFQTTTTLRFQEIVRRLRELAYLNPGLKITARQFGEEVEEEVFYFEDGLRAFVCYLNGGENLLLAEPIYIRGSLDSPASGGSVEVELAIHYNDSYGEIMRSYVNDINTVDLGTHVTGFKQAFTKCFNNFMARREEEKASRKRRGKGGRSSNVKVPSGDSYREGMVCVLSVKVPEPQFAGQNKTKLGNPDIKGVAQQIVGDALSTWIEENPTPAAAILNKALEAQRVRDAVRKARDLARKTGSKMSAPKKLADCGSKKPEESEIFLVEGDSAGGSARQGRDAHTQAILPLRGKILNVWKATPDRMLGHEEIKAIVMALGTGILEEFDEQACRYHKIIIMCDADIDGSHIRTLLLTFLFRQMPRLIELGYVYLACPPLYGVQKRGAKNRNRWNYVLDESSFSSQMFKLGLEGAVFTDNVREESLEEERLLALKALVERLLDQDRRLSRRGLTLAEYMQARDDDGRLLHARVTMRVDGKEQVLTYYEDQEFDESLALLVEAKENCVVWEEGKDSVLDRGGADLEVCVFKNKMAVAEQIAELEGFGFSFENFLGDTKGGVTDEKLLDENFDIVRAQAALSPYTLRSGDGKKVMTLDCLRELPGKLIELGKSNIIVKRFKGLGEMNADELWDTTMDPGQRKLFQVRMSDVAEAVRSFSILMGSQVEPRRHFIERRALEVTDLDV